MTFWRQTSVRHAAPPRLETSRGTIETEAIVVCPGDDFTGLHADRIAQYRLTRCKLHMMRVRGERFDARLPAIMSDLGLARYLGYAAQPAARALRARLQDEQGDHIRNGGASDRRAQRGRLPCRGRFPPLRRHAGPVRARQCR